MAIMKFAAMWAVIAIIFAALAVWTELTRWAG